MEGELEGKKWEGSGSGRRNEEKEELRVEMGRVSHGSGNEVE